MKKDSHSAEVLVRWGREILRPEWGSHWSGRTSFGSTHPLSEEVHQQLNRLDQMEKENEALFSKRKEVLLGFAKKLSRFEEYVREREEAARETTNAEHAVQEGSALLPVLLNDALHGILTQLRSIEALRLPLVEEVSYSLPDTAADVRSGEVEELTRLVRMKLEHCIQRFQETSQHYEQARRTLRVTEDGLHTTLRHTQQKLVELKNRRTEIETKMQRANETKGTLEKRKEALGITREKKERSLSQAAQLAQMQRQVAEVRSHLQKAITEESPLQQQITLLQTEHQRQVSEVTEAQRVVHTLQARLAANHTPELNMVDLPQTEAHLQDLERRYLLSCAELEDARRTVTTRRALLREQARAQEGELSTTTSHTDAGREEDWLKDVTQRLERLEREWQSAINTQESLRSSLQGGRKRLKELYEQRQMLKRLLLKE